MGNHRGEPKKKMKSKSRKNRDLVKKCSKQRSLLKHSVGHFQAIAIKFERFFPLYFLSEDWWHPCLPGSFPRKDPVLRETVQFQKKHDFLYLCFVFLVFPWVFLFLRSFLTVLHYFHCFFYVFPWVSTIFLIFFIEMAST